MLAIVLIFFLSGATGLVYEVLWAKYLGLFLGNTSYAQAIVLATFLGGLAIGNALLGRLADRHPSPLKLYGLLELGIALFAALSPWMLSALGSLYLAMAQVLPFTGPVGVPVKMLFAAIALLPPTILMGGTLPVLSRTLTRSIGALQGTVSGLYFLNSAGAVIGALAAGFWVVPAFGLDRGIMATAILNAAIGLAAFGLAAIWRQEAPVEEAEARAQAPVEFSALQRRAILVAVLVSGFVSLSFEIAWIRLLSLVMGSSTYSFSVMLAAFVAGIALGSLLVNRGAVPGKNPLVQFAVAEAAIALSILLTLPFYDRLPYVFYVIGGWFTRTETTFYLFEGIKFLFCFGLMLIPTTLIGMTLPLATLVVTRSVGEVATQVGRVFSFNTLGNVLGALLTGLLLMPLLGMRGVIEGGVLVCLLVAAAICWTGPLVTPAVRFALAGLPLLAFLAYRLLMPGWDLTMLSSGPFRSRGLVKGEGYEAYREAFKNLELKYYKDDAGSTVAVFKDGDDLQIDVNGKTDASTSHDMATQTMIGHLPLFLRPGAQDVFVVGLGSGVSVGSLLTQPETRVAVAEISPAIAEAARHFGPFNHEALDNPRTRLYVADALSHLQVRPQLYDAFVCEPSNPWVAGNANLFTEDFYQVLKTRLKPGGLVVQWVHTYEIDNDSMALIWRTFTRSFPHVSLWQVHSTDWVIVGSDAEVALDFAKAEARFAEPEVRADLARVGVHDFATVLAMQAATDAPVRRSAGAGPVNTLRMPRLEYQAPMAFYRQQVSNLPYNIDQRAQMGANLYLQQYLAARGAGLSAEEFARIYGYMRQVSIPADAVRRHLMAWQEAHPDDPRVAWELIGLLIQEGQDREAWDRLQPVLAADPNAVEPLRLANKLEYNFLKRDRGYLAQPGGAFDGLIARIEKVAELDPARVAEYWQLLAKTYLVAGRPAEALVVYERAIAATPSEQQVPVLMEAAEAARSFEDTRRAAAYAARVLELQPDHPDALALAEAILQTK